MNKPISQREARAMRKELRTMRAERTDWFRVWGSALPGGREVMESKLTEVEEATLFTAQSLGFILVVRVNGRTARFHAIRP